MNRFSKMLAAVSGVALVATPSIAIAAPIGTASGSTITNTVTVNYEVGGVTQTAIQAQDTFTVDRKIDLLVQTTDTANVEVSPGELAQVTTFTVTNESNATIDFLLAAFNAAGDDFDVSNMNIYVETDGSAGWSLADTDADSLFQILSGDTVTVYIVADINDGGTLPTDGQIANVILQATAAEGVTQVGATSAGTGGSAIAETPSGTPNGVNTVETVYADTAGTATGDVAEDGKHSATSGYVVAGADLTVTKVSRVISDGLGNTFPNATAIPGATVEYCILVTNGSGAATATSIAVTDPVPTTMTPTAPVTITGPVASTVDACTATGTGTGAVSGQNVSGTLPDLDADEAAALVFQATIN